MCVIDKKNMVIPLELKSRLDASKVRTQLQAGAQFAGKILSPVDKSVRLRPVAVAKSFPKPQRDKLVKLRVSFGGRDEAIRMLKSGKSFAEILKE